MNVFCPYCNKLAHKVDGSYVYPHLIQFHKRMFYMCFTCDAYVGTHVKTGKPYGTLATAYVRACRRKAHDAFDPLWKTGKMHRQEAYKRLATALGLKTEETHIGMFDGETCLHVVAIVKSGILEK